MAGLVPAIHALLCSQDVDARHKAGHDVEGVVRANNNLSPSHGLQARQPPASRVRPIASTSGNDTSVSTIRSLNVLS